MPTPRYSIVIPTIDSEDTLPSTIETVLTQSVGNFEIIVADSSTTEATTKLLSGIVDSRIKSIRTPGLSMRDNWEEGVEHAAGEYVFVLGDDDALMPDALEICEELVRAHEPILISWPRYFYGWPNAIAEHARNRLFVHYSQGFAKQNGKVLLQEFFSGRVSFEVLPMIYNSFVRHDLIGEIRKRHGRYFNGEIADVHSGIMNAYYCGDYVFSNRGLSLSGSSGSSSGASGLHMDSNSGPWRQLASGYANSEPHDALMVGTAEALFEMMAMAEFACAYCAFQAKGLMFAHDDGLQIDVLAMLRIVAAGLPRYPASYRRRKRYIELLAQKFGLNAELPDNPPETKYSATQGVVLDSEGKISQLIINCAQADIRDIACAARLARAILPAFTR